MKNEWDCLVVGCGFAGAVIAREHAERGGKRVLIIDKRSHIGGNAYDSYNNDGILIHNYGPHIFHTQSSRVFDYLSRFTKWRNYSHEVLADIYGKRIPVPFNLNSLYLSFEHAKAKRLEQKLISVYGWEKRVTISELRGQTDSELLELADFIYENVFMHYTQKQWGTAPEDIDPSVTARVPILISYDNRYFQDKYQGIPAEGYTSLFEKLIDHPNIELQLNTDSASVLKLVGGKKFLNDKSFYGRVIYTGAIDELFNCCFGRLPYRTLEFLFETHEKTWYQPKGTINYTVDRPYTRITEFKHITGQIVPDKTTIMKEYPREYTDAGREIPYYAIMNTENLVLYERYKELAESIDDFYLLGRLAEYKYYNMDVIVERALMLADSIIV
ncbi:MAG: UDP-galactopyranose mutase [Lutisporaceae bacterium]|jgi:UDP-galactopyranose mutase